jgi:SAM-dependent methyltransferase
MSWFLRDFDDPAYFDIYADKAEDAVQEGPALAALLDLAPGSRVLDLPCGWGRLQPYLLDRSLWVVGGDLSPLNLRRHAIEHPGRLVRLDLRALPFRAACVEGVFCAFTSWGYFGTLDENRRQIEEFARVLSPGGVLLLDLAGRNRLLRTTAQAGSRWRDIPSLGYAERVRWSRDGSRIRTERRCQGKYFRHDIWIPTDLEVRSVLADAGFDPVQAYGGLDGRPWEPEAERWIYRALRP